MNRRIGIYAGTFDPIHIGHVAFALEAAKACGLDEILFLPERSPRAKAQVSGYSHRLAMIQLATAMYPYLSALDMPDEQFTVSRTLPELTKQFKGDELTLLMGSDVAEYLHAWDDVPALLQAVSLAIGLRQESAEEHITELMAQLAQATGVQPQYTCVTTDMPHIASSYIRQRLAADAVHPEVALYSQSHSLYQP